MKAAILVGLFLSSGTAFAQAEKIECITSLIHQKPKPLAFDTKLSDKIELSAFSSESDPYSLAIFRTGDNQLVRISDSELAGPEFMTCEARGRGVDINNLSFQINIPHTLDFSKTMQPDFVKLKLVRERNIGKAKLVHCAEFGENSCWAETVQSCEKISHKNRIVNEIIRELIHKRIKRTPTHVLMPAQLPKAFQSCKFASKYISNHIDVELRRRRDLAEGPTPHPEPRALPTIPISLDQPEAATAQ